MLEAAGAKKAGTLNLGTAYYEDKFLVPRTSSSTLAIGREPRRLGKKGNRYFQPQRKQSSQIKERLQPFLDRIQSIPRDVSLPLLLEFPAMSSFGLSLG